MAGDGGRAPDVSEQRSVRYTVECSTCDELDTYGYGEEYLRLGQDHKAEHPDHYVYIKAQWYLAAATPPDPASVLAALLAEQPDATIAALETLLTSDEAMDEAAAAFSALDHSEADLPHSERSGPYEYARFMFAAACRSLRPKAPKEDR